MIEYKEHGGGFEDPRYTRQRVEELERRLKKLESMSVPFMAHQRGAFPGHMRAVQIGDFGLKSNMVLTLNGNQPGQAPYQQVTDSNGTIRAEVGNLAANGISPAQYGFRANNAAGTPIFDSLGLIAVMKVLGSSSTGLSQNITTTTPTVLTGSAVTFSLTRQTSVLILSSIVANTATNNGSVVAFVDGSQDPGPAIIATWGVGGPTVTSPYNSFDTLAAGSHTIDLRGSLTNTPGTFTISGYSLAVFQLGA